MIVVGLGKLRLCALAVQSCQASSIASGTAISAPTFSARYVRALTPSSATDASAGALLDPREDDVDRDAEKAGRECERVQLIGEAVGLRDVDRLAEAGDAHEELRGERENQRDRRRDAQARAHVRDDARERDPVEALAAAEPERAARVDARADRRRERRTSSGRAAARRRRTRRGRPRCSGSSPTTGRAAGSAPPTGSAARTRSGRGRRRLRSRSSRGRSRSARRGRLRSRGRAPSRARCRGTRCQKTLVPARCQSASKLALIEGRSRSLIAPLRDISSQKPSAAAIERTGIVRSAARAARSRIVSLRLAPAGSRCGPRSRPRCASAAARGARRASRGRPWSGARPG